MNLIEILLLVIAITELARLVLSYKKPTKKIFFQNELYFLVKRIWNKEFEIFQKRGIREGIRKEHEYLSARLDKIKTDIENWSKDADQGEKARREDDKVRTEADIKKLQDQMRGFDLEIEGCKPCVEYPEGLMGLTGEIEGLKEVQYSIEDWIKQL